MSSIISAKNLTKKFGKITAVDSISFEVEHGSVFAFLGPNGAGKSTTIKMITTLLQPTEGSIILNGHDVTHNQNKARQSFGIVFQDPSLDDQLTAFENMMLHAVLYGIKPSDAKKRALELLTLVELDERKNSFVREFSAGMKRRLEIARGLLHHPKVLFLDEPTVGLDAQTRNLLWEYVIRLSKSEGMTVFFTTHYLEEAEQYAQQINIIDHGKIVAEGTPKALIKKTGTKTLEEAYLKLTGSAIRDEKADSKSMAFMRHQARGSR